MTESPLPAAPEDPGRDVGEPQRFERLLLEVSSNFVDLPIGRIDEAINDAVRKIVITLGIERSTLLKVDPESGQFHATHSWAVPGFQPLTATVSSRAFPWAWERLRTGRPVVFSHLDDLPPEAAVDRASAAGIGLRAHVSVPVMVSGEFMAVLSFGALRRERRWPDALVARMRLLADIFGSALARRRAQDRIDELLGFERLLVDLSTSLVGSPGPDLEARLQEALRAIATFLEVDSISLWDVAAGIPSPTVTHRWIAAGASVAPDEASPAGLPWIVDEIVAGRVVSVDAVADLPPAGGADADALRAAGVRKLLVIPLRNQDTVVGALALASMRDERPWNDEVVPRLGVFGNMLLGALAQRSAELRARQAMAESVQSREHLAHLARVDAVGAMTAAIAHEIKQPLMAIANYAQAGRRRLAGADPVDRDKLDELLEKAGSQAALASEVLDRLRAMVKRRETQEARIDLPVLLGNALQFIEIEGRLKDVRIESSVPPDLPPGLGDEIQIQQVVMNLAHNAMEAMTAVPARERVLRVEAEASGDDRILIRVADRGPGIPVADTERVFEPFHTTKETGLGIGLSICRSIVDGHGGSLWHVPRPGGGTVFEFTLPVAKEGA